MPTAAVPVTGTGTSGSGPLIPYNRRMPRCNPTPVRAVLAEFQRGKGGGALLSADASPLETAKLRGRKVTDSGRSRGSAHHSSQHRRSRPVKINHQSPGAQTAQHHAQRLPFGVRNAAVCSPCAPRLGPRQAGARPRCVPWHRCLGTGLGFGSELRDMCAVQHMGHWLPRTTLLDAHPTEGPRGEAWLVDRERDGA